MEFVQPVVDRAVGFFTVALFVASCAAVSYFVDGFITELHNERLLRKNGYAFGSAIESAETKRVVESLMCKEENRLSYEVVEFFSIFSLFCSYLLWRSQVDIFRTLSFPALVLHATLEMREKRARALPQNRSWGQLFSSLFSLLVFIETFTYCSEKNADLVCELNATLRIACLLAPRIFHALNLLFDTFVFRVERRSSSDLLNNNVHQIHHSPLGESPLGELSFDRLKNIMCFALSVIPALTACRVLFAPDGRRESRENSVDENESESDSVVVHTDPPPTHVCDASPQEIKIEDSAQPAAVRSGSKSNAEFSKELVDIMTNICGASKTEKKSSGAVIAQLINQLDKEGQVTSTALPILSFLGAQIRLRK